MSLCDSLGLAQRGYFVNVESGHGLCFLPCSPLREPPETVARVSKLCPGLPHTPS